MRGGRADPPAPFSYIIFRVYRREGLPLLKERMVKVRDVRAKRRQQWAVSRGRARAVRNASPAEARNNRWEASGEQPMGLLRSGP